MALPRQPVDAVDNQISLLFSPRIIHNIHAQPIPRVTDLGICIDSLSTLEKEVIRRVP